MCMRATVTNNLKRRFQSCADLLSQVDGAAIKERPEAPNHISEMGLGTLQEPHAPKGGVPPNKRMQQRR